MDRRMRYYPALVCLALGTLLLAPLGVGSLHAMGYRAPSLDSLSRYEALIDSSFTAGHLGDYARAEIYLREALRLAPRGQVQAMLLNNLVRRKEYKAALTDFALLISAHPRNELYLYQRAMLYLLMKEYDLAENDLKSIIEGNGESLKARIGYALLETMRGRYDEAERLYSYLTNKLPRNAEVYEGRARMFLARGMRGFAQRDINLACEYARGKAPATLYRLRAELNEALGNKKEAQEDLRQAEARERNIGIQ